jgi:hypothetical protein
MQISSKPLSPAELEPRKTAAQDHEAGSEEPGASAAERDEAQTERQAPPSASPGEAAGS